VEDHLAARGGKCARRMERSGRGRGGLEELEEEEEEEKEEEKDGGGQGE